MASTYDMCQKCARLFERGAACGCATPGGPILTGPSSPQAPVPPDAARSSAPPQTNTTIESAEPNPVPSRSMAGPQEAHTLSFHGSGGSFFGIHVTNMLLTVLTLGIYYFWGKAKVRHYLYGQSEFSGDRFAYHGTGRELLWGFLRATVVFGGLSLLVKTAPLLPGGLAVKIAAVLVAYLLLFLLIPFAVAATRRYRLSRSSWRGIRFSFRGSIADFVRLYLKGIGLSILTLGLYYPYFVARQQKYLVSHSYFGNARFRFDGEGRELLKIYFAWFALLFLSGLLAGVLTPLLLRLGVVGPKPSALIPLALLPIAGVGWFSFQANKQRYVWNHTLFGSARFSATMTGGRLLGLKLGNALLLVLTLGLAWPWTMVRNANFLVRHLALEGALDLAAIHQEAQPATALGEGLDSLMDLDAGFAA
ncbi:MAG TPA: YjgN family protein [Nitrospiria bacterium]|nr:YjgN family protein [Nitrospiria bacterium]